MFAPGLVSLASGPLKSKCVLVPAARCFFDSAVSFLRKSRTGGKTKSRPNKQHIHTKYIQYGYTTSTSPHQFREQISFDDTTPRHLIRRPSKISFVGRSIAASRLEHRDVGHAAAGRVLTWFSSVNHRRSSMPRPEFDFEEHRYIYVRPMVN